MKRKGIYSVFIIWFCVGFLFGCGSKEKEADKSIMLHAGEGMWEMEYIWEGSGNILWDKEVPTVSYVYDSLPAEEYLKREIDPAPVVLIANSRMGYKIRLGTGQSYRMRNGDRLFMNKSGDVEIYTSGVRVEKKSFDCREDICEVCREYEGGIFWTPDKGREMLFYQSTRQKGKLYITHF